MAETGSYRAEEEVRGLDSELARLEAQVALSWAREARLLSWLGLRDGTDVLELGCGPGFVTRRLRELLPTARLTALDADPAMVARARAAASDVTVVEASATDTGLPDASFDFAIARYLWQHLADPLAAAREALRVLRPGGRLAVIDVDAALYGLSHPVFPEVQAIWAKAARGQAGRGGDRLIGRKLFRILRAAGFSGVELESFVYHSDALGLAPFAPQLDPDRLLPFVRDGVITDAEFERVQEAHLRFLSTPGAYLLMVGLCAVGETPRA